VGAHHPEGIWIILGRLGTAWYFFHFASLPFLGFLEKPLPLPESISRAVLSHKTPPGGGGGPLPSGAAAKPMEKN
jgi:ubiquinol-cytochrome c reductase cytochrome b subunit